jgi:hypothetical protein
MKNQRTANGAPWRLLAAFLSAAAIQPHKANAQATDRLYVAQVCFLEAGWSESDCTAMVQVAKRRASRVKRPWVSVLREYSALDGKTARAKKVLLYPDGDVPGETRAFNARWAELRAVAADLVAADVPELCRGAEHWGGPGLDKPRGRMVVAECAVPTANVFYRVRR